MVPPGGRRLERLAVGQAAGLVVGQVATREGRSGDLFEGYHRWPFGKTVQAARLSDGVRAGLGTAQCGQVPAGAKRGPKVAGQRADVRAR